MYFFNQNIIKWFFTDIFLFATFTGFPVKKCNFTAFVEIWSNEASP